ncbi:MAG: phosphate ABC transporter substrate-binding protein [Spirochaetales bacterium]|jgi:phosphate transport system substrate-binding protein|nr:phosphate ABC transporter substrate-binding protein [Spirochaetales bacterium]
MKKLSILFLMMAAALVSVFAGGSGEQGGSGAAQSSTPAPYTVTVAGSTSVSPLMEMLIAEYAKVRGNVKFNISATGSGDGIKAVPAETAEIGMSSRELSPAEIGTGIDEHLIAIDGIAVIVNTGNPASNLSIEQIRNIYTGAITDWSQVGGKAGKIAVVAREPGSGTRGAFEEIVKFQDKLVKGAIEFDGTGAVKAEISRNADAIGYISLGSVDNSVKPLSVDGVAATTANVVNKSYKIARPFLLLTKKGRSLNGETMAFLDWILTDGGQAIVKKSWISVK